MSCKWNEIAPPPVFLPTSRSLCWPIACRLLSLFGVRLLLALVMSGCIQFGYGEINVLVLATHRVTSMGLCHIHIIFRHDARFYFGEIRNQFTHNKKKSRIDSAIAHAHQHPLLMPEPMSHMSPSTVNNRNGKQKLYLITYFNVIRMRNKNVDATRNYEFRFVTAFAKASTAVFSSTESGFFFCSIWHHEFIILIHFFFFLILSHPFTFHIIILSQISTTTIVNIVHCIALLHGTSS